MSVTWDSSNAAGPSPVLDDEPEIADARREFPAWGVSLAVHVGVVAVLAGLTLDPRFDPAVVIDSEMVELDPEDYAFSEAIVDMLGTNSDLDKVSPSQSSAAHEGDKPPQTIEEQLVDDLVQLEIPTVAIIEEPHRDDLLSPVERHGTTENPGGIEGSLDRLALEIAASLKQKKTLVVWVLDRSPSVSKQREAIANRLDNVYKQLGMLEPDETKSLKTAVVAFGRTTEILTPDPLDDVSNLAEMIRGIEPEKIGDIDKGDDKLENVFTAIHASATKWMHYRKGGNSRNVLIVAVTDEAGSDQEHLEKVVNLTKPNGIKCYVVGSAAPFGRREVEVPWEIDGQTYQVTLRPGPETILPELPRLPFWTVSEADLRQMSSGYGPYALTRLCVETGGLYLISQDTRGPRFDPDAMRDRAPSYATVANYLKDVQSHPVKAALIRTALNVEVKTIPRPRLDFVADNDNILRTQITDAQRPFADFEYQLNELAADLIAVESHRATLADARWQANFDLAMGRMLALKARALGYNATLANMKVAPKPFEKQGSNRWRLVPSPEITGSPVVRKMATDARAYLIRVLDTHPGTPWALLAERELSQPMGWDWQEYRVAVAQTGARPNNAPPARNIRLANENQATPAPQRRQPPPVPQKIKI
ncbi:MAG: vWA domain-containing protein [Planctomycetales bacterium]